MKSRQLFDTCLNFLSVNVAYTPVGCSSQSPSAVGTIQQHVLTSLVWMARYTSSTVLPKKGGEPESSM
jgi:hypothetical protein